MPLVSLIVLLVVLGLVMYLVNNYIPMDPPFKMVLNVVIVLALILWLLGAFGLLGSIGDFRVR